jgi:hypothetical protein
LLTIDGYVLKDLNGRYLIPKSEVPFNAVRSSDGSVLKDLNGLYITIKED